MKSSKKIQKRSITKRSKRPAATHDDYFLDRQIKMILTNTANFQRNLRDEISGNTALIIAKPPIGQEFLESPLY
jgi:hypothetical protein